MFVNHIKQLFHRVRRAVARVYLPLTHTTQVAITGSQGKTALTQSLYMLVKDVRPSIVTDVNLDTLYNVPITALKTRPWHHYVFFELGIDHMGEMNMHLDIVKPDIAVVTGISSVHSDKEHLGSKHNIVEEKIKLPLAVKPHGVVVMHYSDKDVRAMASEIKARIIWFGAESDYTPALEKDYIGYSDVQTDLDGTSFTLHNHFVGHAFAVKTKLIGAFHAQTLTAAYAVLYTLNPVLVSHFPEAVHELLTPLPGRMSVRKGPHHTLILDDSLRANPASTKAGLETFAAIPYTKGRKIAILANMGELEHPEQEHIYIGEILSSLPIDVVVGVGSMQKYTAETLKKMNSGGEVHWFSDTAAARSAMHGVIKPHDFIYLKGSKYSYVGRVLEDVSV